MKKIGLEEALEEPAFYILGVGGTIAVLLGYITSKKMDIAMLPIWQVIVIIIVILIASAFFSTRE